MVLGYPYMIVTKGGIYFTDNFGDAFLGRQLLRIVDLSVECILPFLTVFLLKNKAFITNILKYNQEKLDKQEEWCYNVLVHIKNMICVRKKQYAAENRYSRE